MGYNDTPDERAERETWGMGKNYGETNSEAESRQQRENSLFDYFENSPSNQSSNRSSSEGSGNYSRTSTLFRASPLARTLQWIGGIIVALSIVAGISNIDPKVWLGSTDYSAFIAFGVVLFIVGLIPKGVKLIMWGYAAWLFYQTVFKENGGDYPWLWISGLVVGGWIIGKINHKERTEARRKEKEAKKRLKR